jgi:hypothetical protein
MRERRRVLLSLFIERSSIVRERQVGQGEISKVSSRKDDL